MIKNFKFLQREKYSEDIDILWFSIGKFNFRWFTDYGWWFIYIELEDDKNIKGYRFSSAGNMKIDNKKG